MMTSEMSQTQWTSGTQGCGGSIGDGLPSFPHSPFAIRGAGLYAPGLMFDAVKIQLSVSTGKLAHLRRFL